MKVVTMILGVAALLLALGQVARDERKVTPRQEYGEVFVDSLVRGLQDPHPQTRYKAVRALARVNSPAARKAIPALRCMLYDENRWVREEAMRALKKLDPSAGEIVLANADRGNTP